MDAAAAPERLLSPAYFFIYLGMLNLNLLLTVMWNPGTRPNLKEIGPRETGGIPNGYWVEQLRQLQTSM